MNIEEEENALRDFLSLFNFHARKLWKSDRKGHDYLNIPVAFDIETSSWKEGEEYRACEYCFVLGVYDHAFLGRGWNDFFRLLKIITETIGVNDSKRMIIYVHNLSYEFQFIRKRFSWLSVFAVDNRSPVKAITTDGIEFRCSYILSGYSLAMVGKNLTKYRVSKLVGDLDYRLIRTPITPMTEKEWQYVIHDGLVVLAFIMEQLERNDNSIMRIPLTNTGYVRRYVRHMCYCDRNGNKSATAYRNYRRLMKALTIDGSKEYGMLKDAFQGGFTHARAMMSDRTIENVTSYDFTSSYPYSMISEYYPMSKGRAVQVRTKEEFMNYINNYCCLFTIEFFDLTYNEIGDVPISKSKCQIIEDGHYDNGRVTSAKHLMTTMTEVDFAYVKKFYDFSKFRIRGDMYIYERRYLPTPIVFAILKLYGDKTSLKGVVGKETEYMHSKGMINACYGMVVTDIVRDENIYDEDTGWSSSPCLNQEEAIDKYNKSKGRFLFYPWGVWVTAWSRRHLFEAIYSVDTDYIYADTDSIKLVNVEKHRDFFVNYNARVEKKLRLAMKHHRLDFELCRPKTIQGVSKLIGVFDDDGNYRKFRTLGAKRYIKETFDGKMEITISGVAKIPGIDYLKFKYKDDVTIFENFADGLVFPSTYVDGTEIREGCGKKIHIYIDEEHSGIVHDYQGREYEYDELSSIYMAPTSYDMTMTAEYIDLLKNIRTRRNMI